MAADLYDLTHAANAKRPPKPYPRPTEKRKTLGGKAPAGNARAALERLASGGYGKQAGPARNARGQFTKQ